MSMRAFGLLFALGRRPRWSAALFWLALCGLWGCAAPPAEHTAPAPQPVAGTYQGHLGDLRIELVLTEDQDAADSVHGWYRRLDAAPASERTLLAGEFAGDALSMEESHNGVDVSGTWSATLDARGFHGTWSDVDGQNAKAVELIRHQPLPAPRTPIQP